MSSSKRRHRWILRICAIAFLLWSALAFLLTHPSIAKQLSIVIENPWEVEGRLKFLYHCDGHYEQVASYDEAMQRFRETGGSDGPYSVLDVKLFSTARMRGLWAPTSFRRTGWVIITSPTPGAEFEAPDHAPILVPLARDIWSQKPRLRPIANLIQVNTGPRSSLDGVIAGPWRTNWWGYVVNALTLIAIGVLTSTLWWKRVQSRRARRRESPAIPAH